MSDRTDVRHAAVRWRRIMLLLMTLTAAVAGNSAAARPLQYQIHGFAAQAYAHSDGNNYVGSSLDGSFEFFELGLNGSVAYGPLTVSAQGLVRKFGEIDDGQPRLDYGFADYRLFSTMNYNAGIRAGRVKNYYGLYNDSRDVVFTRPGVLLPGSVYFESTGIRALLFSSDGGRSTVVSTAATTIFRWLRPVASIRMPVSGRRRFCSVRRSRFRTMSASTGFSSCG